MKFTDDELIVLYFRMSMDARTFVRAASEWSTKYFYDYQGDYLPLDQKEEHTIFEAIHKELKNRGVMGKNDNFIKTDFDFNIKGWDLEI